MSTLLAVLLNILIAAILYIILTKRIDTQLNPKEMLDRIRNEVEDILKELNHTTERNIGLIEDRIDSLKGILETADRRLSLLRREAEKQEVSSAIYSNIVKKARPIAQDGGSVEAPAEVRGATDPVEASGGEGAAAKADASPEQRHGKKLSIQEQVLDLNRKGISASVIASRLGSTIGEVELIISIQGNRASDR